MTTSTPAFAVGASASAFTAASPASALSACRRPVSLRAIPTAPRVRTTAPTAMADDDKKGGLPNPFKNISNPFAAKPQAPTGQSSSFMAPQPGDPGYVAPPPVPKGTGMDKSPPRPSQAEADADAASSPAAPPKTGIAASVTKLPVVQGAAATAKRGLDLLREDLLKSAPERAGIGRQDSSAIMKPMAGEPGYKPAAYETVKVSDLGISPFPDDANAVGKVGGVAAVKKAALEVKKGEKTAKEIKKEVLKMKVDKPEDTVYDIPSYLKPIPEDTPRKGRTWKNYVGR